MKQTDATAGRTGGETRKPTPLIVGILNLTPDSFSDGGRYNAVEAAARQGLDMAKLGAGMIDVGGESTRPGAQRVAAAEQVARIAQPIEALSEALRAHEATARTAISIDTTQRAVAEVALDAGATVLNDISAGQEDPAMFQLAAERDCPIILMHMQGQPATMQEAPTYAGDVVEVVRSFLLKRAEAAEKAGIARERIILDPGIGFGKTLEHNLRLLANLHRFVDTGYDVMLGASRKGFIKAVAGESASNPQDRVGGTAATTALGVAAGVKYFRVHDVAANVQAARVTTAILGNSQSR